MGTTPGSPESVPQGGWPAGFPPEVVDRRVEPIKKELPHSPVVPWDFFGGYLGEVPELKNQTFYKIETDKDGNIPYTNAVEDGYPRQIAKLPHLENKNESWFVFDYRGGKYATLRTELTDKIADIWEDMP